MHAQQAQEIATEWANLASEYLEDADGARVVLARALVSLVTDEAPVAILIDDDTMPLVGAVVGTRLLLASASAGEQSEPIAECRAVALSAETQVSLTYIVRQAETDGLYSRRRWTVTPAMEDPVSFYTASSGREGPDTPFAQALAQALGWSMPDPLLR